MMAPMASRFVPALVDPDPEPVAHRRRGVGRAGADVAPQPSRRPEVGHDEVQEAIAVEVGERRAAPAVERDDPGRLGALRVHPVRPAEEQVVRILLGVVRDLVDVALGHEQVHVPIVVHVLELRMPGRRRQGVAPDDRPRRLEVVLERHVMVGGLRTVPTTRVCSVFAPWLVR